MPILLFFGVRIYAQKSTDAFFNDYKPVRCAGVIPSDFRVKSSAKIDEAKQKIKESQVSKTDKKQEIEYAVTSGFAVDEMLSSGQILFGDSMSEYVERVAINLLKKNDQPELVDQLRFYVLKSPVPNAYCTSNGAVLVSIGLLSRLENEAQLAFILAHEIQHYVLKHSVNEYKKIKSTSARTGRVEDRLAEIYNFSKENETEADENGFKMMRQAGYNLDEGVYVFDMLKYTQYPFLEIALPIDSFETAYYKFPENLRKYVEEKVKEGNEADEKYLTEQGDDKNTTHPSLDRRINRMRDLIADDGNQKNKPLNFIAKSSFDFVSKMARHELLLLYIRYADFGNAYYLAEVMQKLYGPSLFVARIKAMSIYGLVHHKALEHDLNRYGCNTVTARGEWRSVISLLDKMELKELCAFGSRQMFFIKKAHKTDPFIDNASREFFKITQVNGLIRLSDLTVAKASAENTSDTIEKTVETDNSAVKNPRNRVKRNASSGAAMGEYYMQVFADVQDREYLQKLMKDMQYSEPVKTSDVLENKKKGKAEQVIDKLVLFPPQIELAYGNDKKRDLFQEEDYKDFLSNTWTNLGEKANVNVDVLKASIGEDITLDAINDYMALTDWIIERLNNDTQSMLLFNSQSIKEPMQRKKTKHVGWVSYEYSKGKKPFQVEKLVLSMFTYLLPVYLVWQFSPEYQFKELCVVYDTETGRPVHVKRKKFSSRLRGDLLNAQVYETLYNVKYGR
jgi:hypothetical protein